MSEKPNPRRNAFKALALVASFFFPEAVLLIRAIVTDWHFGRDVNEVLVYVGLLFVSVVMMLASGSMYTEYSPRIRVLVFFLMIIASPIAYMFGIWFVLVLGMFVHAPDLAP